MGGALVQQLVQDGYRCLVVSRSPQRTQAHLPAGATALGYDEEWPPAGAVINMAGESIAGLWTASKRQRILNSRLQATQQVVEYIRRSTPRPAVLLSMSAVGYYGNRPGEYLTEASPPDPRCQFRAQVTAAWEEAALAAEEEGVRVVLLRLGNVLHPAGGFLGTLLQLYRYLPIVSFGRPESRVSWVSLHDTVQLIHFALEQGELAGPLNVTAPHPAGQGEFTRQLAAALGRRVWGRVPGWAVRLGLGRFAAALLDDQAIYPERALAAGFEFAHPEIGGYLRQVLAGG